MDQADANLELQRSPNLLPPHLRIPCTRSRERPVCQLLDHLEACNQFLFHFGLQLREDEADDLGDVRLVVLRTPPHEPPVLQVRETARVASDLLQWLIRVHRCLVSVDVLYGIVGSPRLTDALMRSPGLRKLGIRCVPGLAARETVTGETVAQLIAAIDRVEELAISYEEVCADWPVSFDCHLSNGRSSVIYKSVGSLPCYISEDVATKLVAQLIANNTVTSLAVGYEIFRLHSFSEYLTKMNPTLRILSLKSTCICDAAILKTLVTAISTMSTLEQLDVEVKFNGTQEIGIFAEVVAWNRSLRGMSLKEPTASLEHERLVFPSHAAGNQPEALEAWLPALEGNSVLERLTIDFHTFRISDCHAFFRAVAQNKSLKQLVVLNLPSGGSLKAIYGTIRECGLAERVLIKNHCLDSATLLTLADCSEVTAAVVDTLFQDLDLHPVLDVLDSCGHISSVYLRIDRRFFDDGVSCILVEHIARDRKLKELWLNVVGDCVLERNLGHYVAPSGMVRAISSNWSLNIVTLMGMHFTDADSGMLVEAAVGNPNLYHVELVGYKETNLLFLRLLAPVLARSYNLLRVRVPTTGGPYKEEFVVRDLMRRNSSLVMRAARFVMGCETSYCAQALEFVSAHPKLVEMVEEQAAVSCEKAKEIITRTLSRIAGMNGFMRAAGVVRERVECWARRDGEMQLHDLNDDSWSLVRKYLKVADILEPPHATV